MERLSYTPWSMVQQLSQGEYSRPPHILPQGEGRKVNIVHYIGIATDETERVERWKDRPGKVLPLVQIGWDEAYCKEVACSLQMLAPTYATGERDGCWFCHNAGVAQLRRLRHDYPELWAKMMQWDADSPVSFHADGHTVHDFDKRFQMEDDGLIDPNEHFRWKMLEGVWRQTNIFDFLED